MASLAGAFAIVLAEYGASLEGRRLVLLPSDTGRRNAWRPVKDSKGVLLVGYVCGWVVWGGVWLGGIADIA